MIGMAKCMLGASMCVLVGCGASVQNVRPLQTTHVPTPRPKAVGMAAPNVLSPQLRESVVAQGSMPMENGATPFLYYGYYDDGPMLPLAGDIQSMGHNIEATKTEPDKNVYLVLPGQHGADADYAYGTHFLYQGHEGGIIDADGMHRGYLSRINLDADDAHRITLLATTDVQGKALPTFDGITWNPYAQRLLLTAELGDKGGVWQASADFPAVVEDISGALGRGGYEGIQNDADGNIWMVEDVGGKKGSMASHARQPNGFLYRFVPKNRFDLTQGGKLQALQVINSRTRKPIIFHDAPADPDVDILSQDMRDLHTYGNTFATRWITLHDTDAAGNAPFNANALAKTHLATPFKRPENGQFQPGTGFRHFFFTQTGDTDMDTEAAEFGGYGAIMRLTQSGPSSDTGVLTLFYRGDAQHAGLDNLAFWDAHHVVVVEDAGDKLHTQRKALDCAYIFDTRADYSQGSVQPVRILAQGRDASATLDSSIGAVSGNGFQNDGDNEITGIHISDGDPSVHGLLGAKYPRPFKDGWRVFYTQMHGDNVTYEILPATSVHAREE